MSKAETWAKRVAEWQASGQSSTAYCEGQEFTAGGLRHWAHRLRTRAAQAEARPTVRMLRVERVARPAEPAGSMTVVSGVAVRVGRFAVVVERDFDRATLAAVLAVVAEGHGA
jgi:transposase